MRAAARIIAIGLFLASSSFGCATTFGSQTIPRARFDYNEALRRSWNEQMLLNLVRLRYRDTPEFLEISSVLTQYTFEGDVGASTLFDFDANEYGSASLGAGVTYSERPTVTYVPLQGKDFAQQFLSPLSPATIVLLSQSGWSGERLLLTCVNQINEVRNAPSAAGPTPDYVPSYEGFLALARAYRQLQVSGCVEVGMKKRGDGTEALTLRFLDTEGALASHRSTVYARLGLDESISDFEFTGSAIDRRPDQIALVGRSLMAVMFFLSHSVEAPAKHEEMGLVTVTRHPSGERFDWGDLCGAVLRVRSSPSRPPDAFVSVRYRDHWYSIADADLNSKTTFGLLKYLFLLQSNPAGRSPLLTLSAGS